MPPTTDPTPLLPAGEETSTSSLVHEAALLVQERIDATSVAIYETWPDDKDCFFLTGSCGGDSDRDGRYAELRPVQTSPSEWIGLTSFVAFHKQRLNLKHSPDGITIKGLRVAIDTGTCEISNPGPFLAEPVLHRGDVLGVIRALRRSGDKPFGDEEERILIWIARFLALSFIQERMRGELVERLTTVGVWNDEVEALETIAREASRLVHGKGHASALLLHDPKRSTSDRPFYAVRAPKALVDRLAPETRDYPFGAHGLTPAVLFSDREDVFSLNLPRDTAEGGPLHDLRHETKPAELGAQESRSFMAVRIPGGGPYRWPFGAIRISSPHCDAFSRRDIVTLRALASQTGILLREQDQRDTLLKALVDTLRKPIVAIDKEGNITLFNREMQALLGFDESQALGKPILQIAYAGRKPLARANRRALDEARDNKLRGHYTTVYRRCSRTDRWIAIPVSVDASYLRSLRTGEVLGSIAVLEDLRDADGKKTKTLETLTVKTVSERKGIEIEEAVTGDAATAAAMRRIERLWTHTDAVVLIQGKTGTGKELFARAIAEKLRPGKGTRTVNCAGLSEDIMESDLFGSIRGTYTGATDRPGVFSHKDTDSGKEFHGTVILDEIQELTLPLQAKLLRVLDKGTVRPVGAQKEHTVDLRVIALTSTDLDGLVDRGSFRPDLKVRLEGVTFRLRPLRERNAEIALLADHFLQKLLEENKEGPVAFADDALRAMLAYPWPGNVRELQGAIRGAFMRQMEEGASVDVGRGAAVGRAADALIGAWSLPERVRDAVQTPAAGDDVAKDPGHSHVAERLGAVEEQVGRLTEEWEQVNDGGSRPTLVAVLTWAAQTQGDVRRRVLERDFAGVKEFLLSVGYRLDPKSKYLYDLVAKVARTLSEPPATQSAPVRLRKPPRL